MSNWMRTQLSFSRQTTTVAHPGLAYAGKAHVGTIDVNRSMVLGRESVVCIPNIWRWSCFEIVEL